MHSNKHITIYIVLYYFLILFNKHKSSLSLFLQSCPLVIHSLNQSADKKNFRGDDPRHYLNIFGTVRYISEVFFSKFPKRYPNIPQTMFGASSVIQFFKQVWQYSDCSVTCPKSCFPFLHYHNIPSARLRHNSEIAYILMKRWRKKNTCALGFQLNTTPIRN